MKANNEAVYKRMTLMQNFLNIVGVSVLWVLLSIPLVSFGPSTIALYHTVVQCIRRGEGHIFRVFFNIFHTKFKAGAIFGSIVLVLAAILLFNIRYANYLAATSQQWQFLSYIYTGVLILLTMITAVGFPLLSHIQSSFVAGVKLTFLLTFRHLFTSITCFLVVFLAFQIGINLYACLLFLPGACCLVNSLVLESLFAKYLEIQA